MGLLQRSKRLKISTAKGNLYENNFSLVKKVRFCLFVIAVDCALLLMLLILPFFIVIVVFAARVPLSPQIVSYAIFALTPTRNPVTINVRIRIFDYDTLLNSQ